MRAVYRNPKELATCLKDLVDTYLEDLISYENFSKKVMAIVNANEGSVYKEGHMPVKLIRTLGEERAQVIDKVVAENN
ncbi:conserved hypothetical protein [Clostridium cavendishii DSM 21758]|uniref:TIGR04540 family protein n=1 Tax=Clostridium cavendishii DSM 21758 TaxID=1121302 RepID=A0A1M6CU78_9CLOT|nr:TIGR04540 family protein [Clostridium cavendishii]SHI64510.1 conserved hypothetical protein [Clostridium cavendishii DSM 21758]